MHNRAPVWIQGNNDERRDARRKNLGHDRPPLRLGRICHNLIGPLIVWLIKKDTMPFVDDQGKESLNFQITVTIAAIICGILVFVLIGIPLLFAVGIAALVLTIMAGIKANEGASYRYPFAIRLIK